MKKTFTVRTDHGSLCWLMQFKNPEGQIARWLKNLSSYDMKIEHRAGKLHKTAHGLSRIPCNQCGMKDSDEDDDHQETINRLTSHDDDNMTVDIKCLQEEDSDISLVKTWVKAEYRPEYKEVAEGSYFFKSLWNQWPRLQLEQDVLVRKWEWLKQT